MANIERLVPLFHDMWASLIELVLGIFILSKLVGPAAALMLIPATSELIHFLLRTLILCKLTAHSHYSDKHCRSSKNGRGSNRMERGYGTPSVKNFKHPCSA